MMPLMPSVSVAKIESHQLQSYYVYSTGEFGIFLSVWRNGRLTKWPSNKASIDYFYKCALFLLNKTWRKVEKILKMNSGAHSKRFFLYFSTLYLFLFFLSSHRRSLNKSKVCNFKLKGQRSLLSTMYLCFQNTRRRNKTIVSWFLNLSSKF